jgi:hypothetical protein
MVARTHDGTVSVVQVGLHSSTVTQLSQYMYLDTIIHFDIACAWIHLHADSYAHTQVLYMYYVYMY